MTKTDSWRAVAVERGGATVALLQLELWLKRAAMLGVEVPQEKAEEALCALSEATAKLAAVSSDVSAHVERERVKR